MTAKSRAEIDSMLPKLRRDFELSKQLVSGALSRAAQAAEQAAARRRQLAEGARERDRNLAIIAHELRQPLAAAVAAERVLATHASAETRAHATAVLARQLDYLSRLVDSLLDFSRLNLQTACAASASVDINAIVADAVEAAAPVAEERGQTLACATAPGDALVLGDATRLRQAVANLLQNALRYTPRGGRIDAAVTVERGEVRVHVRDTGEGFTPDRLDEMLAPFVRVSTAGAGLGIGLPLVKRIVELHGGRLAALSGGPDAGSCFTIVLPTLRPSGDE